MPFFFIILGVILIVLNIKAIKKEKNSFETIVRSKESEITDFDVAIGELRREFSETILELQKEIYAQRDLIEALKNKGNVYDENLKEVQVEEVEKAKETVGDHRELINEENDLLEIEPEIGLGLDSSEEFKSKNEIGETQKVKYEPSAAEKNSIRIKEIGELIDKGVPLDDICEKYNIGKGEVLLIKELYLR